MEIIDTATVAVSTAAELKSILEGNNSYTTVYLAADIQMVSGITILASKTSLTIDGTYPADGAGVMHTLTDMSTSNAADTIRVSSASSIQLTVQNINIVGANYYTPFCIYDGSSYAGTNVYYYNVTYVGPQFVYHANGLTRIVDCDITIVKTTGSACQEVAEVYQLEIGGNTRIVHTSTSNAVFWFRDGGSYPSLTILPGATVTLQTANYGIYTSPAVAFTVSAGASFTVATQYGFFRDSGHQASAATVADGATFTLSHAASYGSIASFYCNGAFTVGNGATLIMQANYASAGPLIRFAASAASFTLNSPKRVALYNSTGTVFSFSSATPISIGARQINYWLAAAPIATAGTLADPPLYAWRKSAGADTQITASATSSKTTVSANNFTADELAALPALTLLQLHSAYEFSAGYLPLEVGLITDDGYPIEGETDPGAAVRAKYATSTLNGAADESGAFSLETPDAIPETTSVTVTANQDFLFTSVVRAAVDAGTLELQHAPDRIEFSLQPVAVSPVVLLGRVLCDWCITVSDTRARSAPWYLYATVNGPLSTEDGKHTLPDALAYVGVAGEISPLCGEYVLVYAGEGNAGSAKTTDVTWAEDKGVLLQVTGEPFHEGAVYSAHISWTLSETPLL